MLTRSTTFEAVSDDDAPCRRVVLWCVPWHRGDHVPCCGALLGCLAVVQRLTDSLQRPELERWRPHLDVQAATIPCVLMCPDAP